MDVIILGTGLSSGTESAIRRIFMTVDVDTSGTSAPEYYENKILTMPIYAPTVIRDIVEIVKPKQPNFARFQNNFKQRGRKSKKHD